MKNQSLSYSASLILKVISDGCHYGFDIMDITGLPSGTVYPALRRLESAGLLTSRWEAEREAREEQRPARKYYRITRGGEKALAEAISRYRALQFVSANALKASSPSEA